MDSVVGNGCKSFGFGNLGIRSSGFTFAYQKKKRHCYLVPVLDSVCKIRIKTVNHLQHIK